MKYFVRKHNHLNKSLNVENNCYSKNQPTGNYIVCSGFLVQYVRAGMQNVFKWVSDNMLLLKVPCTMRKYLLATQLTCESIINCTLE